MIVVYFFSFILVLVYAIYFRLTSNFDFWKKRNVKGPKPIPFIGNYLENLSGKTHLSEITKKYYDEFKSEKMVGTFMLNTPALILRDLNLIQEVLIKNFAVFSDRGINVYDKIEPLSQHFFNLPLEIWRPLRSKLSPPFRLLKIKDMFHNMAKIADDFVHYIEILSKNKNSLECCSTMSKYMVEVIGEFGFDLKLNEFTDDMSLLTRVKKMRPKSKIFNFIRRFLREYCPNLYKRCYFFATFNRKQTEFFVDIIKGITEYRKNKNIEKDDYIGHLINLRNPQSMNTVDITDNFLAAQAYVFFTAGSDTTAIIVGNALYELAVNISIQTMLRKEINQKLNANNGKLTLECLKSMKYLDNVFKETLRKYPLRNIIRQSNRDYTFSGENISIPKNTRIIIPHYAIHHDEELYDQPEKFDPDRFNIDIRKNVHPMAYLPFGDGPRICIGARFAEYISKLVIVKIIDKFNIVVDTTCSRNKNDARNVLLVPEGGIRLKFEKL